MNQLGLGLDCYNFMGFGINHRPISRYSAGPDARERQDSCIWIVQGSSTDRVQDRVPDDGR